MNRVDSFDPLRKRLHNLLGAVHATIIDQDDPRRMVGAVDTDGLHKRLNGLLLVKNGNDKSNKQNGAIPCEIRALGNPSPPALPRTRLHRKNLNDTIIHFCRFTRDKICNSPVAALSKKVRYS